MSPKRTCTFTTAQLATVIANVARDPRMTSERLRHWTREGLLDPTGGRHPGTGVHRRYSEATAARAAVLSRLADMGFRVTALEGSMGNIVKRVDFLRSRWEPGTPTFLVIAFGRAAAVGAPLEVQIGSHQGPIKTISQVLPAQNFPDFTVLDLGQIFQAIEEVAVKS